MVKKPEPKIVFTYEESTLSEEEKRVKHVISTLRAEMQNRCDICDLVNENVNQGIKIDDLTQKLEKARGALKEISITTCDYCEEDECSNCREYSSGLAQQASNKRT